MKIRLPVKRFASLYKEAVENGSVTSATASDVCDLICDLKSFIDYLKDEDIEIKDYSESIKHPNLLERK
jgi:hypothetical protein